MKRPYSHIEQQYLNLDQEQEQEPHYQSQQQYHDQRESQPQTTDPQSLVVNLNLYSRFQQYYQQNLRPLRPERQTASAPCSLPSVTAQQLEITIQQIQEQLQLNLLQQAHIIKQQKFHQHHNVGSSDHISSCLKHERPQHHSIEQSQQQQRLHEPQAPVSPRKDSCDFEATIKIKREIETIDEEQLSADIYPIGLKNHRKQNKSSDEVDFSLPVAGDETALLKFTQTSSMLDDAFLTGESDTLLDRKPFDNFQHSVAAAAGLFSTNDESVGLAKIKSFSSSYYANFKSAPTSQYLATSRAKPEDYKLSTMQLQHQLSIQQQELIQQLQLVQRQYLMHQGMSLQQAQHQSAIAAASFMKSPLHNLDFHAKMSRGMVSPIQQQQQHHYNHQQSHHPAKNQQPRGHQISSSSTTSSRSNNNSSCSADRHSPLVGGTTTPLNQPPSSPNTPPPPQPPPPTSASIASTVNANVNGDNVTTPPDGSNELSGLDHVNDYHPSQRQHQSTNNYHHKQNLFAPSHHTNHHSNHHNNHHHHSNLNCSPTTCSYNSLDDSVTGNTPSVAAMDHHHQHHHQQQHHHQLPSHHQQDTFNDSKNDIGKGSSSKFESSSSTSSCPFGGANAGGNSGGGGGGGSGDASFNSCYDDFANTEKYYHPLYAHGMCRWPGCELVLDDVSAFLKHLNSEHSLDDRSTAQARVQMQVVSQLEIHLQKERDRLQAMMHHLYLTKQFSSDKKDCNSSSKDNDSNSGSSGSGISSGIISSGSNLTGGGSGGNGLPSYILCPPNLNLTSPIMPVSIRSPLLNNPNISSTIRKRISDKTTLSLAGGLPYMLERAGLDVQQEIQRNREFYKNADVRPPFTYASLIRQSIIESPDKQLTLNEIYNWFQNTFCYFRRNAATWKNAIRTNLSLHKCFVRYEDDFGSFWMVDDNEFVKRRHLSRGRPRKYEPSTSTSPTSISSQHGSAGGGGGSGNHSNNSGAGGVNNNTANCGIVGLNSTNNGGLANSSGSGGGARNHHITNSLATSNCNSGSTNDGINAGGAASGGGGGGGMSLGCGNGSNGTSYLSGNYQAQNVPHGPLSNSSSTYANENCGPSLQNIWSCPPVTLEEAALTASGIFMRHHQHGKSNNSQPHHQHHHDTNFRLSSASPTPMDRSATNSTPMDSEMRMLATNCIGSVTLASQQQHCTPSEFLSVNEKIMLENLDRKCRNITSSGESMLEQQHQEQHMNNHSSSCSGNNNDNSNGAASNHLSFNKANNNNNNNNSASTNNNLMDTKAGPEDLSRSTATNISTTSPAPVAATAATPLDN